MEGIIILYRIKQFYLSITAKISQGEKEFVAAYLNIQEQELFFRLQVSEQKHCINVAYDIKENEMNPKKEYLIRLALLHDIGKIKTKLTPIDKAVIVIIDKVTKGKVGKYTKYKKVKVYYHHGEMGYELLKEIGGYDEDFLEIIRKHHGKGNKDDELLMILQQWDDRN